MKSSRYSPEQVALGLRQAEDGVPVAEVCRKMGISKQTFYRWKKKLQGMGVAEVRRLRVLEEENRKLKQLVADLSLDKQMLGSRWTEAGARFQPRIHMEVISGLRSEVDRICLATYRSWERVKDEVEVLPDVGPATPHNRNHRDVILAEVLLVAHPLVTRYEQVVPGPSGGLQQVAVTKPVPAPVGCGVNFMVL